MDEKKEKISLEKELEEFSRARQNRVSIDEERLKEALDKAYDRLTYINQASLRKRRKDAVYFYNSPIIF